MPRTKEANQRILEEQRAKILEAARRVLARHGLAATMDDIAAEAGISHGLAYRYFASKEAIVRALIEEAIQQSPELQHIQELPGTPGARLDLLISQFVESRRGNPEFYQLLDRVLHDEAMPEDFRKLLRRRGQALQGALRQLIVEGQATGEVAADDPDQLVRALFAAMNGLTSQAAQDRGKYGEHFPEAQIFLRMFKP